MDIELYRHVALKRNIPEAGLCVGDLATLIEIVPHPKGGAPGCVIEVFNALGDSIRVLTVTSADIEVPRADEVLSVRPLRQTR